MPSEKFHRENRKRGDRFADENAREKRRRTARYNVWYGERKTARSHCTREPNSTTRNRRHATVCVRSVRRYSVSDTGFTLSSRPRTRPSLFLSAMMIIIIIIYPMMHTRSEGWGRPAGGGGGGSLYGLAHNHALPRHLLFLRRPTGFRPTSLEPDFYTACYPQYYHYYYYYNTRLWILYAIYLRADDLTGKICRAQLLQKPSVFI